MSDETRSIPPVEPVLDPKKDYEEINSYVVFLGPVLCSNLYTGCWLSMFENRSNSRCLCSSICTCHGYSSYFETEKCVC